ncbi:MAG: hypothetical protein LBS74_02725, partial [Oscillospiraceae bacterium]|nr:hypothetical protein [Oscillospiraceae bacterium]
DEYSAVVGFAAQADDEYLIVNEISIHGKYDGYMLRKTENLFRIDYDSYYENSLFKVFNKRNVKHKEIPEEKSTFVNFIQFAKASGFVVSVGIKDYDKNSVTGYIDSIDLEGKTFVIHTITQEKEGGFDGFTAVNFDGVFRMRCDSGGDRFYQELNEMASV